MKARAILLTADQVLVMQCLKKHPLKFMSNAAIAKQAGDAGRYGEDPRWPNLALFQLTEMKLLKIGADGGYRIRTGLFTKCPASQPNDR